MGRSYHNGFHSVSLKKNEVVYELTKYPAVEYCSMYEGWNFNSGNYLFTTDTK